MILGDDNSSGQKIFCERATGRREKIALNATRPLRSNYI